MGKKDGQMQIMIVDMDALIPKNHLLKKINNYVEFDFVHEKAATYYSKTGRPSVEPICIV